MADIIQFVPRATLEAEKNLGDFIELCRTQLKPFGRDDIVFDANTWRIRGLTSKGNAMQYLYFTRLGHELRGSNGKPAILTAEVLMREPFLGFAKALISYMHAMQPTKAIGPRRQAFRYLEAALVEVNGTANPTLASPEVLNHACALMLRKTGHGTAYSHSVDLSIIYSFMVKLGLVTAPSSWISFIKPPQHTRRRVGKVFDEIRNKKLPNPTALEAIAEIFNSSTSDSTEIAVSSLCALMLCSPDRATEVLYLSHNCLISDWKDPETGEVGTGLEWFPLKGGKPMVKTVIPSMSDIAKRAVEKLRYLSEPARNVARWYEANPGKLYLPTDLEYMRNKDELTIHELGQLLFGGGPLNDRARKIRTNLWVRKYKLPVHRPSPRELGFVSFRVIEKLVLDMLPEDFPILDRDTGMRYSEALCIARPFEFNSKANAPLQCGVLPIRYGTVATSLKSNGKKKSIFEKRGLKGKDGHYFFITTHMMRHYLNTLVRHGGVITEAEIALWSGRRDTRQNKVYDHVSDRDRIAYLRKAVSARSLTVGPLTNIDNRVFITRDEFASLKILTAHTTDFGHCIHDFSMMPCQIHGDCINCNENLCVKGDADAEANLRKLHAETKFLLEKAKDAMIAGEYGANEWIKHQSMTLERTTQLISILDDPAVPNGAIVQISGVAPASWLAHAEEKKMYMTKSMAKSIHTLDDVRALLEDATA